MSLLIVSYFSVLCIMNIILSTSDTILTPRYGSPGGNTYEALDQGRIYSIKKWAKVGTRIQIHDWRADEQDQFDRYGTGADPNFCIPFTLSLDDYIIGYKIYADDKITGLQFHTRNGNTYSCIADGSAPSYTKSYNYSRYNFYYLTGWKIRAGAIIDQLQFQFTKSTLTASPTLTPTNIPTMNPTNIPTIDPTLIPTMDPTNIPTITPSNFPTTEPTYNPTNIPTMEPTDIPTPSPTYKPTQGMVLFIDKTETTHLSDGEVIANNATETIYTTSDVIQSNDVYNFFATFWGTVIVMIMMGLLCISLMVCIGLMLYIYHRKHAVNKHVTSKAKKQKKTDENKKNMNNANKENKAMEGNPNHLVLIKIASNDTIGEQITNGFNDDLDDSTADDDDEYLKNSPLPKSDGETDDEETDDDDDDDEMYLPVDNIQHINNDNNNDNNDQITPSNTNTKSGGGLECDGIHYFQCDEKQIMQRIGSIGSDGSGAGFDLELLRIPSVMTSNGDFGEDV